MRVLIIVVAILGLGLAGVALAITRSDIQLILAAVGFFSAIILLAIGEVLSRIDKQWNFMIDIDDRLRRREDR